MDARSITEALGGKWHGSYGSARCPAHRDTHPSLSISPGQKQALLLNCHSGCAYDDIVAAIEALGIPVREDRPFSPPTFTPPEPFPASTTTKSHIDAIYQYRDENNSDLFETVRYVPKNFKQRHRGEHGEWVWNLNGTRRVLYRLPELAAADPRQWIYIPEGEKDVERLRSLGLVATCNPMGAGKWSDEYNECLRGRTVVLIQDNDDAGVGHVALVRASLAGIAAQVITLQLPNLPDKGDVSDWLDAGGTVDQLRGLAELAQVSDYPLQTLAELVASESTDEPELVAGLLWSGRAHWLFSAPNSGKTLLAIAMGLHVAAGVPFHGRRVIQGSVVMIEEDSPLSVVAEYVAMLADIYEIDLEGLPFYITKEPGLRIADSDGKARALGVIQRFNPQPSLVIFDSSERVIPSDKFSTKEFDPFGSAIQVLSSKHITTIIIDHTRKLPTPVQAKEGKAVQRVEPDPIDMLYGGRVKSSIADVMLYMTGKVSKDAQLRFVKFRGEEPTSMTIGFQPDEGFIIRSPSQMSTKTPTETAILGWIQNGRSQQLHTADEIFAGAKVKPRSGERALTALVKRAWLVKEGVNRAARFRLNPGLPGVFE